MDLEQYHVVKNESQYDCHECDVKFEKGGCPFSQCPLRAGYYFKKNKL